ncbi:hypothetical protein BOVA604_4254 [Bacteroides ovatus]|nr:hypothetical protein BOVA604_4254 [Bacteroides ovatus]
MKKGRQDRIAETLTYRVKKTEGERRMKEQPSPDNADE